MGAPPLLLWIAMQIEPLPPEERLVPVPPNDVRLLDDGFFTPRFRRNLEVTLFAGHDELEKHGQFKNFRLAAGKEAGEYCGVHFYDSDAYKWLEAASLALAYGTNPRLEELVDRFIGEIAAAQQPDGYVQTQYTFKRQERWSNLADDHELYCAGHLIQAAVAHHEATGKRTLYDVALKLADCIDRTFGPGKRPGCCGHPEIETALVQLWRHSGERRWLELAKFFLDERGQRPPRAGGDDYHQDHKPIREQTVATGHAVRQLYLCAGMTGVAAETGDRKLFDAALAISRDIDSSKLYVTGGVGARHDGEAFGKPFELPNQSAYAETCASIALMRFSEELLALTGQAAFADRVESTLYNAFLASTGEDGKSFFYVNPLESSGGRKRQEWFWCACCPPNIMRTLAGLPGWIASTTRDALYVHLYDDVEIDAKLGDGRAFGVRVDTAYPWFGDVVVAVTKAPAGVSTLALRVPGWLRDPPNVWVEGAGKFDVEKKADGYLRIRGPFLAGTKVTLSLSMPVETVSSDPRVADDVGKVALRVGPVVYAFESQDQPEVDLFATAIDVSAPMPQAFDLNGFKKAGLGCNHAPYRISGSPLDASGIETCSASDATLGSESGLYRRAAPESARSRRVALHAIPYFAWANRGDSKMRIWMPVVSLALAAAAPAPVPAQAAPPPRPEATFAGDVAFLKEKADVVVIQSPGCGPIAVSPKLTARVMTSAFTENDVGFGLVVRESIEKPPVARGFNNFGGEDRLWFAPEGGPYGLYFDPGAKQVLDNWYVPLVMDGQPRKIAAKEASWISFEDRVQVTNVKKVTFDLLVKRKIEALARADVEKLLNKKLDVGVHIVAFRTTNSLSNASNQALPKETALISPWILGQFKATATSEVLMPFKGKPDVIKNDYFGVVPPDRLKILPTPGTDGGVARFKADAQLRSKIGVSAAGAVGWLGAFDKARGVLTLVNYPVPAAGAAIPDCAWTDPNPKARSGDVATSYDHGQEPRFFELESIGAAMPVEPGGATAHVHTTIHLGGDPATLAALAKELLRAEL